MIFSLKNSIDQKLRNFIFEPKVIILSKINQPVLIWTMGKVGSTSIAKSLYAVKGISIFTAHFMDDQRCPRSQVIYKHLIKPNIPLKIISLVRDPISKNISSFFQNFEKNTGRAYADNAFSIDELNNIFFNDYKFHYSPLTWFDDYVKTYTGIDVYSQIFSQDTKACRFKKNNFELLVMRCDLEDNKKEKNVESFLDLKSGSFKISARNVGSDKDYSKIYRKFKNEVRFSNDYLEKMTNSKYFNHFYSSQEIQSFINHWKY